MSIIDFATKELTNLGWLGSEDEMSDMMAKNLLELLKVVADQGHSGFSASYLLSMFNKLANFKPLTPLTGEDWEWNDMTAYGDEGTSYQNARCSSVFKNAKGECYDIDGKVFWEWSIGEDGEPYKSYYTCRDSRVPVTFPYTVPDKPIYEWRYSEATPQCPPQTEEGLL